MQNFPLNPPDTWRHNHLGHWLRLGQERFEARVMALMAQHPGVSLGLSNLAMGAPVNQCEAWGMVQRNADSLDARARRVCFTATGRAWLAAYQDSVAQAEDELRSAIGAEVATVVALGLEAYSAA